MKWEEKCQMSSLVSPGNKKKRKKTGKKLGEVTLGKA